MAKDLKLRVVISAKDEVSKVMGRISGGIRNAMTAAARPIGQLTSILGGMVSTVAAAGRALWNFGARIIRNVIGWVQRLGNRLKWLAIIMVGIGVEATRRAIGAHMEFGKALAEVSTLVDTSLVNMKAMERGILSLSTATGESAIDLTKGLYQTISAGVAAGDALSFLGSAAKAAVGGVTDTATAVDGLTTLMNAWGKAAADVTIIADSMFVAVKAGKTTFGELARAYAYVASTASAAGLSIDEINAALAAMTTQGMKTQMAARALNQALISITQPMEEVQDLARSLGVELSETALREKGLVGIMEDLSRATGGSVEKMGKLLGSSMAARAGLALTGAGGKKFAETLELMNSKTGAASEAYEKMAASGERAWARLKSTLFGLAMSYAQALEPAVTAATSKLQEFAQWLGKMGVAQKAGRWIAEMAQNVMDFVDSMVSSGKLARYWEDFKNVVGDARNFVVEKVSQIREWIEEKLGMEVKGQGLVAWLREFGEEAGKWIRFAAEWVEYLWARFQKAFPSIAATALEAIFAIGKAILWLVGIGDAIFRFVDLLVHSIGITLTTTIEVVTEKLIKLIDVLMILPRLMAKIPGLGNIWKPMVDEVDKLRDSLKALKEAATEEADVHAEALKKAARELLEAGGKFAPEHEKLDDLERSAEAWRKIGAERAKAMKIPPRPIMPGTEMGDALRTPGRTEAGAEAGDTRSSPRGAEAGGAADRPRGDEVGDARGSDRAAANAADKFARTAAAAMDDQARRMRKDGGGRDTVTPLIPPLAPPSIPIPPSGTLGPLRPASADTGGLTPSPEVVQNININIDGDVSDPDKLARAVGVEFDKRMGKWRWAATV